MIKVSPKKLKKGPLKEGDETSELLALMRIDDIGKDKTVIPEWNLEFQKALDSESYTEVI